MFNSGILDVVISLIFIYLLLALACTAANELIEAKLKNRSKNLEKGIRELLSDETGEGLACRLYRHPLIYSLYPGNYEPNSPKNHLPSYIPAKNFSRALVSLVLTDSHAPDSSINSLRAAIEQLDDNSKIKGALAALVNDAGDDIDKARKHIEEWYDSGMDRVSGWFKRYVQRNTIIIALAIAVALNVDTINIATRLSYDSTMRQSLVAAAQEYAKSSATAQTTSLQTDVMIAADCTSPECRVEQNLKEIQKLGLPLGWRADDIQNKSIYDWLAKILGLAITAFAVSLGAPFWFDMLNKIMVVRSTVKPQEKSPNEPAVDR
jgi:hypothetical protein